MSWLSKGLKSVFKAGNKLDPLGAKIMANTQDAPGSAGALRAAALAEDTDPNPYGAGRNRLYIFAGGDKLSRSPKARATGRAVGTFFAGAYGGPYVKQTIGIAGSVAAKAEAARKQDEANALAAQMLAESQGQAAPVALDKVKPTQAPALLQAGMNPWLVGFLALAVAGTLFRKKVIQ